MSALALIPARLGSKGISQKNFRALADGPSCVERAIHCAVKAGCEAVVSTDAPWELIRPSLSWLPWTRLERSTALAQDDTPMLDVVTHALQQIPGPEDQIIVLLQPTQPLRKPEHVQAAIALLQETGADSVVSVVELPRTHHPAFQCHIEFGDLLVPGAFQSWATTWQATTEHDRKWLVESWRQCDWRTPWRDVAARRQDVGATYRRDGTVYAFYRRTLQSGTIYGADVRPLIIPPDESCELDTLADWEALERRLRG